MPNSFVLLLLCVAVAFASRVHVERTAAKPVPAGWKQELSLPSPSQMLTFTYVLELRDPKGLEEKFWAVSDPKSPYYAKYMTVSQIARLYGPSNEDIAKVRRHFADFGITEFTVTPSRDFVTFSAPVSVAERLFGVKFRKFTHKSLPTVVKSCDPYSLPSEVAHLVKFVTGIHSFPSKHKLRVKFTDPRIARSFDAITPQVIWQTFLTNGTQGTNNKNIQAVAQFLDQFYDPNDLSDFQSNYNLPSQTVAKLIGPNDPTNPGTEASLDIQYITATAPMTSTWFWSTGPPLHGGQEDFVRWAQDMNKATTVPLVMSVSYGDDESSIDKGWADRLNQEFQKLATRGVSILFASGDNGVGCTDNCVHSPNWPASSPFVTSVGGFVGTSSGSLIGDGISSGGFSDFYSMPSYQKTAVQNYLANGPSLPPSNQYNATSRAMPDVSSFSENVMVYQGGGAFPVGGTSCAAPVFSGVISLVNDALLNANKSPVGFLNPALYQIQAQTPGAFIDITTGNNAAGCCTGFTATTGWDPITGLGGPNFPVLRDAFLRLQKAK